MAMPTERDYHVGWICALEEELTAAMAMLDEEYEQLVGQNSQDRNSYVLGRIYKHNVVIAGLPLGVNGLVSAANVADDMSRTFPALRFGLMVGIGGGIPGPNRDIRLGDIVVSIPVGGWGGVVQWDKGKAEDGGTLNVTGQLIQPPPLLLHTLTRLRARHTLQPQPKFIDHVNEATKRHPTLAEQGYTFPTQHDCLYCSVCDSDSEKPAAGCQGLHQQREIRRNNHPMIHYGTIASANQVVKDAVVRDRLRDQFGAICVETEAAGLMNAFRCLVIRGICDYADKYKNDVWRRYAAITAAAYAKEVLLLISPIQTSEEQPIQEVLGLLRSIQQTSKAQLRAFKTQIQQSKTQHQNERYNECHRTLKVCSYEEQKERISERATGTCQWVLTHPQFIRWKSQPRNGLLWISGDPGCGKSVLARSLVDNELRSTAEHAVCYFFFNETNNEQDNIAMALCSLLHQLFSQRPQLIQHAMRAWEKSGNLLVKGTSELWRILLAAARDDEAYNVTCVIDALDECRPSDRRSLIAMLAKFYAQDSSTSSIKRFGHLKFLITGRPYYDIRSEFQTNLDDLSSIRLEGEKENDSIQKDIDTVIRIWVDNLARDLTLDDQTRYHLSNKLSQMKNRTYLWLYLALEGISDAYRNNLRPSQVTINSLPSSVYEAYEKILARVPTTQKEIVRQILQIVVGARRPLTIGEMAIALGLTDPTQSQSQSLEEITLDSRWLENRMRDW